MIFKRNRKGQLQTFETIAVLFIFFVLLGFTMIFFAGLQKSKTEAKMRDLDRSQSIEVAKRALNLPELRASRRGVFGVNTFDTVKLDAFGQALNENFDLKNGLYSEIFSSSSIEITEIYPGNRTWLIYDAPLESSTSVFTYFVPISLYNPLVLPSALLFVVFFTTRSNSLDLSASYDEELHAYHTVSAILQAQTPCRDLAIGDVLKECMSFDRLMPSECGLYSHCTYAQQEIHSILNRSLDFIEEEYKFFVYIDDPQDLKMEIVSDNAARACSTGSVVSATQPIRYAGGDMFVALDICM